MYPVLCGKPPNSVSSSLKERTRGLLLCCLPRELVWRKWQFRSLHSVSPCNREYLSSASRHLYYWSVSPTFRFSVASGVLGTFGGSKRITRQPKPAVAFQQNMRKHQSKPAAPLCWYKPNEFVFNYFSLGSIGSAISRMRWCSGRWRTFRSHQSTACRGRTRWLGSRFNHFRNCGSLSRLLP